MPLLENGRFVLGEDDYIVVCPSSFRDKSRKPILALLTLSDKEGRKFTCPYWDFENTGPSSQVLCEYVPFGQLPRNCSVLEILFSEQDQSESIDF